VQRLRFFIRRNLILLPEVPCKTFYVQSSCAACRSRYRTTSTCCFSLGISFAASEFHMKLKKSFTVQFQQRLDSRAILDGRLIRKFRQQVESSAARGKREVFCEATWSIPESLSEREKSGGILGILIALRGYALVFLYLLKKVLTKNTTCALRFQMIRWTLTHRRLY